MTKIKGLGFMASVAAIALMSGTAHAKETVEQRLDRLEAENSAMRVEIDTLRGQQNQTAATAQQAQAQAEEADAKAMKIAAAPPPPPASAAPTDGFTATGGTTRVKVGGFVKTVASVSSFSKGDVAGNALGRDFYLPQQIPVSGTGKYTVNDFSAKQSRFWVNLDTTVAGHSLKAYVETDFQTATGTQGSERTTNGYNLALRRAYVQFDGLTIGQDWSTFQNTAVLPESTDFVGVTEGTTFVRQPLIRYSTPLGKGVTLHISAENPETASALATGPALTENDDDSIPDVAARVNISGGLGDFAIAGLFRQLKVDNGILDDTATGYGVSASGKIFLTKDKAYNVSFMATYGSGIGRYVGLNFAPDAIFDATGKLRTVDNFAAFGAVRLGWTPTVRSNIMVSYQKADYPGGFAAGTFNAYNESAWSVAGNVFYTPVKGLDLGIEYRHGERKLVSGVSGSLNRIELAAKFSF
jgi:Porin subfamily